jgi:hypothetical protein
MRDRHLIRDIVHHHGECWQERGLFNVDQLFQDTNRGRRRRIRYGMSDSVPTTVE